MEGINTRIKLIDSSYKLDVIIEIHNFLRILSKVISPLKRIESTSLWSQNWLIGIEYDQF